MVLCFVSYSFVLISYWSKIGAKLEPSKNKGIPSLYLLKLDVRNGDLMIETG